MKLFLIFSLLFSYALAYEDIPQSIKLLKTPQGKILGKKIQKEYFQCLKDSKEESYISYPLCKKDRASKIEGLVTFDRNQYFHNSKMKEKRRIKSENDYVKKNGQRKVSKGELDRRKSFDKCLSENIEIIDIKKCLSVHYKKTWNY